MKQKEILTEAFMIVVGTIIITMAVYFFMIPSHVTVGSVSGFATVLVHFIPLRISVITFILNGVLLIVGFIFIGRDFGVKTIITSMLLPVFMGVLEIIYPNNESIMGDSFLDMICYLFVVSIGQAILFQWNASSGGLDILGKIINKYFHIELGKAISMVGLCVAFSSAFVSDKKAVVLSVLGTYLSGIVLDHFIFGFNIKKRVCIISEKEEEIADFILHQLHSGATFYEATGAYDNKSRREIITIVNKNEYAKLMSFISKTDPNAFVTIYAVNEVIYKPKV
ncbi:YitT family protein [Lachnospiraceae bacterium 45-P1]